MYHIVRQILGCFLISQALVIPLVAEEIQELQTSYCLRIGSYQKMYPWTFLGKSRKVKVPDLYDIGDNINLLEEASNLLCEKIINSGRNEDKMPPLSPELIVIPGNSASVFSGCVVLKLRQHFPKLEMLVLRSDSKRHAFRTISYQPLTSPQVKSIHMRKDQFYQIEHKRVLILDDIITSGATLRAVSSLVEEANGVIIGYGCIVTEGAARETFSGKPLFSLVALPSIESNVSPMLPSPRRERGSNESESK
jgi:adenine phosphoribosyltransferase